MPYSKSDKGNKEKATPKSATAREGTSKKPPEPSVSVQKAAFLLESPLPWEFIAFGVLLAALFLVQESTIKYGHQLVFFAGAAIIFIFSFIFRINRELLSNKLSPVFLFLLAQSLLFFAGLFYAYYPKFALQQFFLTAVRC
jgi:hypothetical protein